MALPTQMIGGLISGMDTNNIIQQLMSIEKISVKRLETKKAEYELQLEAYRSINTLLLEYSSSASNLALSSTWNTKSSKTSNESIISTSVLDTAVPGTHTFKVARLATSAKFMSTGFASMDSPIIPQGTGSTMIAKAYDSSTKITEFNGGAGVPPLGKITVKNGDTDDSAEVDLSACQTVMDIYTKIFSAAQGVGIADLSLETMNGMGFGAGSSSNLVIENFDGTDTTADNLGLTSLTRIEDHDFGYTKPNSVFYSWNPGSDPAVEGFLPGTITIENAKGQALRNTEVKALNGGAGIYHGGIRIVNGAGVNTNVDLSTCETLNDIINKINTTEGVGVIASVTDNEITLQDVSGGAGSLYVQNVGLGTTADDLGLTNLANLGGGSYSGQNINQLTGSSTVGMLRDGKNINGGTVGELIINKGGVAYTTSMAGATTLNDIIQGINSARDASGNVITGLNARLENNRIVIDATDGQAFSVKNETLSSGTNTTAEDLGLLTTGTDTYTSVSGLKLVADLNSVQINGIMAQKNFDRDTKLSDYGVAVGEEITVTDKLGNAVTFTAAADSTIGDFLDAINSDEDNADVMVYLDPSRGCFAIGDLTGDLSGDMVVSGSAAAKLGFGPGFDTAAGGVTGLRGQQIYMRGINGARDNLSRDVDGKLTANLGAITVNSGGTDYVFDLSSVKSDDSMSDLLRQLNSEATANGLNITFQLNNAKNGIEVVNNSGASVTFSNHTGLTAHDLGLGGVTVASGKKHNAGDLDTQWVSRSLKLDDLNDGEKFSSGSIRITNSLGGMMQIDLSGAKTIGDVLDIINQGNCGVTATINDSGDGIRLTDDSGGEGLVSVSEVSGGKTASMLGLLGSGRGGIDGSFEKTIEVTSADSLRDVMNKVAYAGLNVQCSIINDGSDFAPYRLVITNRTTGEIGDLLLDTNIDALNFSKTSSGRDAVLLYGQGEGGVSPVMMTSSTNQNQTAVLGLTIDMHKASEEWVTLTIEQDKEQGKTAIEGLVNSYNTILDLVDQFDDFNEETGKGSVFFADTNIRSLLNKLNDTFFSYTESDSGGMRTWYDLGVKFKDDGRLEIDTAILNDKLTNSYDMLKELMVKSIDVARRDLDASASSTDRGRYDRNGAINGDSNKNEFGQGNGFESLEAMNGKNYEYTVTFDKIRTLNRLTVHHVNTPEMPASTFGLKDYMVQYLDAKTNKWVDFRTITNNKTAENYFGFMAPTEVRAIKIIGQSTNAVDGRFRLTEIEAFEPQGLAAQQETAINRLTDSYDGWFANLEESLKSQIKSIETSIEKQNERLEAVELNYIRQYTNMEKSLANLTAQGDYFAQQAASWSSSKK